MAYKAGHAGCHALHAFPTRNRKSLQGEVITKSSQELGSLHTFPCAARRFGRCASAANSRLPGPWGQHITSTDPLMCSEAFHEVRERSQQLVAILLEAGAGATHNMDEYLLKESMDVIGAPAPCRDVFTNILRVSALVREAWPSVIWGRNASRCRCQAGFLPGFPEHAVEARHAITSANICPCAANLPAHAMSSTHAGAFGFQKEMGALESLRARFAAGKDGADSDAAQNVQALLSSTKEIEMRVVRVPVHLIYVCLSTVHTLPQTHRTKF